MKKYCADLHVHSNFSFDSLSKPKDILEAAMKKGLSAVAITDHNEIAGAQEAHALVREKKLPLQVIIGEEVATDCGDLLVYFVRERIMPGKLTHVLSQAHEQKAVCVAAHPYDFARHGIDMRRLEPHVLAMIHGVEAFNARVSLASQNASALLFATERRKPIFAGSDAHHVSEVGAAHTEFSGVKWLDAKNLLSADRKISGRISSPLVHLHSRYAVASKKFSRLVSPHLK